MKNSVLTAETLQARWPLLYHLTEAGAWPSIQRHGLLSTAALLDLYRVRGEARESLLGARRPEVVRLHRWRHGTAFLRDNKPMNETVLRRTLHGMTVPDYYRMLNNRVFFFLEEDKMLSLRNAPPYRQRKHELLVLDTAALLARYGDSVELSPYNSGAVHAGSKVRRGQDAFTRIRDYPWAERYDKKPPIAELTVLGGVIEVEQLVVEHRTL